MKTQRGIGYIAKWCIHFFAGSLVLLHWVRRDLNPATRYISEYAVGPCGYLMSAAFAALGVGTNVLAWGLARERRKSVKRDAGLAGLGSFGAALCVVGVYRTDLSVPGSIATRSGRIHNAAALFAFRAILVGMAVLSVRWNTVTTRSVGYRLDFAFTLLATTCFIWLRYTRRPGLAQRAFIGVVVLWLWIVARRMQTTTS